MPPKSRITREMIIDAAFHIARTEGYENINARTVAAALSCSTQPVMYHFATIEELKRTVYEKADFFHSDCLMNIENPDEIMLGIGLNYIRFAVTEPLLFRFLFQSGYASENNLIEMIDSAALEPVIAAMQQAMQLNMENTKTVFILIAVFAHGYASIIANNSLEYDENVVAAHLERAYNGAMMSIKENSK